MESVLVSGWSLILATPLHFRARSKTIPHVHIEQLDPKVSMCPQVGKQGVALRTVITTAHHFWIRWLSFFLWFS